ncbi:MAG: 16S rRNA (cytidine(1402)-2'-O)-methyltransferase [Clostridia bacterium]|nr:16S rRNA (cytidine(1402)-2'-O)-methyltransferase [Clostridia bacterium]
METCAKTTGTLYVCATPIGNLEDITLRVLRILRRVDLIAAEDTRKTAILLARYRIRTPMISCHQHNEASRTPYLLTLLRQGKDVALLSEAGTPGISDPGEKVIGVAIKAGIPVVALPGPVALITALVLSGLPTRRFVFEGFLPRQAAARRHRLEELAEEERTMVFYEAPHRLQDTLGEMCAFFGDREAAVARELTKLHEEVRRGTLKQLWEEFGREVPRGEMVIVVAGRRKISGVAPERLLGEVSELERQGWRRSHAVRQVARAYGVPRSELYRAVLEKEAVPGKGPPVGKN